MAEKELVNIEKGKHEFGNASIEVVDITDFIKIKIIIGTKNVEFFYRKNGEYDGAGMYITSDDDE